MNWINRCHFGDCLTVLRSMPDAMAHTCVTSPPYFGLRDYGHAEQIGLEPTPDEFIGKLVEVFREVRRVLTDDGTLWLNIGDSYTSGNRGYRAPDKKNPARVVDVRPDTPDGLKPKDLIGIPWMLAFALRQPYYTGRIKHVHDRIWLAAMIDAEGCLFIHKRKAGTDSVAKFTKADGTEMRYSRTQDTYGAGLEVANTCLGIVERCKEITGLGAITRQDKDRRQPLYRWHLRGDEARSITREVYPYLVAKRHQARLLTGCPTSGERAEAAHAALMGLHGGTLTDVDFKAPESMTEPGWYLRQDVIWSKANPMPESVTDRCTKAHEYIFLLAKSASYYCDMVAIQEPCVSSEIALARARILGRGEHKSSASYLGSPQRDNSGGFPNKGRGGKNAFRGQGHFREGETGPANRPGRDMQDVGATNARNKRSVWTVSTKSYKGAHFATFPTDLIEPCVLAGAPAGGVVLDPFFGSGTTGQVAQALGRQFIGIELNEAYKTLQDERLRQPGLLLEAA